MNKIKVGINVRPLNDLNLVRGVGFYTKFLIEGLKVKPQIEVVELEDARQLADVDLIHYPYFDLFKVSLKLFKVPTVVTVHDVIPLLFPKHFPPGVKGWLNLLRQRSYLKRAAKIITDSETSKLDIFKKLDISLEKIKVINLAPTLNTFPEITKKQQSEILTKFNCPKKYVVYNGGVNWNKNLLNLTLGSLRADLDLVLIGKDFEDQQPVDHPELASYRQFLAQYSNNPKVHKIGFISDEELFVIMKNSQVLLLPSYYEGFGLTILNAQKLGIPVITSNVSSMPEVAGKGALLVDPSHPSEITEAIFKILSDHRLRAEIIEQGFQNVKNFSWDKTVDETIKLYQEIIYAQE